MKVWWHALGNTSSKIQGICDTPPTSETLRAFGTGI